MIVVGAGIIGLSCAWALARAGRRVRVFDQGPAARQASWAGAGMLAPGGEFESDSELARMAVRSLALYPAFVAELTELTGIPIDFRRCGAIEIGGSAELAAARRSLGIRSEPVENGWLYPDDALVDPRDLTGALLAACRKLGVEIHENEAVRKIAPDEPEGVLIAAGAWSSTLYPGLPGTHPVRGHLIAWQMPPGTFPHILRSGATYIMQRSSGIVLAGSSTEHVGFDRDLDEAVLADLRVRAETLAPQLRGHEPIDRWNGLRPGTDADAPAIGRIPGTNIYTAFGHYRNGILLAPETARLVSELIAGSPPPSLLAD